MTCSKASTWNAGVLDRREDRARTERIGFPVALWARRDRVVDVQVRRMRTENQSATATTIDAAISGSVDALVLELKKRDATIAQLQDENARLWRSYDMLKDELALVKRRLFVATAERVDTTELQLEFKELVQKLEKLSGQLNPTAATGADGTGAESGAEPDAGSDPESGRAKPKRERPKPTGRRYLEDADLPEVRVEIPDPLFEELVAQGKAKRIDSDESSSKLAYERGGPRRVVMVRLKYQALSAEGDTAIETAPKPPELLPRCMASASTLAMIANTKYCRRQECLRCAVPTSRAGPLRRRKRPTH